jgi:undecaprenyl diphosphate synthase
MTTQGIPAHVGIIMDGNGRWAQSRNMARTQGHLEGLKAAKRIVKAASDMGISYLTLYTFSTENWKRTKEEVGFIMGLVKKYLMAEFDFYNENKIRIRFTGNLKGIPPDIAQEVRQVCEKTACFTGLSVILALNYGGRDEIVRAVRKITQKGIAPSEITEDTIRQHLDNPDVPDPDLIIRTAAELRSSNFLLWESAYSEFYFSDKLWPDWDEEDLKNAIISYKNRKRRFGGITA